MRRPAIAVFFLAAGASLAQEEPVLRVDVSPDSVTVGESVEVQITVLVPTWFARPPGYPDFELANAITRLPPDSAFPTSERISGETWSGIVRRYRMYPLVDATYRIAGETIKLAWANPGADPFEANLPVPEIVFRATVPDGAERLDPYIAGRDLSLSLEVSGERDQLEVGDAVVLTWAAELDGLPAIFLPPLAPEIDFDGISEYADEPDIEEGPPARRSESVTLVFEAGGEFVIPPLELEYWNTGTNSIETAAAPGTSISVTGPAAPAAEIRNESREWRQIVSISATALLLAGILAASVPRLAERARARAELRKHSEKHAFHELCKALRSGRPRMAYERLLAWTRRLDPPMDARDFAQRFGDETLTGGIDALSGSIYGEDPSRTDLATLCAGLEMARRACIRRADTQPGTVLPPLNP